MKIWWEAGGGKELGDQTAALVGLGVGLEACAALAPLQTPESEPAAATAGAVPGVTPAALEALIVAALAPAYGAAVVEELVGAVAKSWSASDLTYASAGQHRDYGHSLLRQPAPWGVHFAGTETEAQNGHVEGAVRAGERAASEVLEALESAARAPRLNAVVDAV